jgi:hypothetical protein
MTTAQKGVFLSDMRYVLRQARAYRDYENLGADKVLVPGNQLEQTIHDALLESSLSFLRKVNEFFGKNVDASVRAFFPDYPLSWLLDSADRELLNNRVMHLSLCHALEGRDFDWTAFLSTHLPEAERRFDGFLQRLKQEQPELFATND